jgi:hypothetical protein
MRKFRQRDDDCKDKIVQALENAMLEQDIDTITMMSGVSYWLVLSEVLGPNPNKDALLDYLSIIYDEVEEECRLLDEGDDETPV